jgi:hypothetical protein
MSTVSLKAYINDLRNLDRQMSEFTMTARVIRRSGASFEARTVFDYTNESGKALRRFEQHLVRVTKEIQVLIGGFTAKSGADSLIETFDPREKHLVPRLKSELAKTHKDFRKLVRETIDLARDANRRLNDPGRYGSGAVDLPLNKLIETGFSILDFVAKILKRYNHPLVHSKR